MKTNFQQTEILKKILETLIIFLNVTETERKNESFWDCDGKKRKYTIIFANCNFHCTNPVIKNIAGYKVKISDSIITIENKTSKYEFVPDQILTIYERIKKIRQLKS